MIPIQPLVIPSTAVAQYHLGYTDRMPKAATSRGLEFSNTPPPTMTSTSAPASPPRSSSAPLDVGCVPERPDTVTPDPQAMDQLIQFESGPDIPSLIPSPPPSDLPSNYNGRILPLLPPQIICDIGESSSSEDESDSDLDEMSPEKLNAKMAKAKDKLRMVFKMKLDYWLIFRIFQPRKIISPWKWTVLLRLRLHIYQREYFQREHFHFGNLSKTTTAENRKEKIIAQRSQTTAEDEIGGSKES